MFIGQDGKRRRICADSRRRQHAAVAWHNYNFKPLKIMLAFKLSALVDDATARLFWKCLMMQREEDARKLLPPVCEALKARLHELPDHRSREILGEGLDWVIKHPECVQLSTEQKIAAQGHFPNLVAFTNLLSGLHDFSKRWKKRIARITHDEQCELERTLTSWHGLFANADPRPLVWLVSHRPAADPPLDETLEAVAVRLDCAGHRQRGRSLLGAESPSV